MTTTPGEQLFHALMRLKIATILRARAGECIHVEFTLCEMLHAWK